MLKDLERVLTKQVAELITKYTFEGIVDEKTLSEINLLLTAIEKMKKIGFE